MINTLHQVPCDPDDPFVLHVWWKAGASLGTFFNPDVGLTWLAVSPSYFTIAVSVPTTDMPARILGPVNPVVGLDALVAKIARAWTL